MEAAVADRSVRQLFAGNFEPRKCSRSRAEVPEGAQFRPPPPPLSRLTPGVDKAVTFRTLPCPAVTMGTASGTALLQRRLGRCNMASNPRWLPPSRAGVGQSNGWRPSCERRLRVPRRNLASISFIARRLCPLPKFTFSVNIPPASVSVGLRSSSIAVDGPQTSESFGQCCRLPGERRPGIKFARAPSCPRVVRPVPGSCFRERGIVSESEKR